MRLCVRVTVLEDRRHCLVRHRYRHSFSLSPNRCDNSFFSHHFSVFELFFFFLFLKTDSSGSERIRQDLRRRHVSAGVVLGLNPHQVAAAGRVQTTLNNAVPHLWGSDPLAQEIEGLLDSAPSIVNDSVMSRSQSVPLHRMLQQFQSQGITRCEFEHNSTVNQMSYGRMVVGTQGYATASQPSTPFGCGGRNFTYNASATSSPYSYTATPVPAEWNDFNSNTNNGEINQIEIIRDSFYLLILCICFP